MSISHDEILFYVPDQIAARERREMLFMMSNMDELSGQVVKIFSTFLVFPAAIPLHLEECQRIKCQVVPTHMKFGL